VIVKPITHRTYGETANYVLASYQKLGIAVPPGSRVARMAAVVFDGDGNQRIRLKKSDPDFLLAREVGRDLTQLAFVFDSLPGQVLGQFLAELKKTVDDQALPQHYNGNTFGRDSQFHLYVAAVAQNAGFLDLRSGEPDVVCRLGDAELGIAAKRVKTTSKLATRIKKASDQIARSQRPGLIAVDTSLALNRKNDPFLQQMTEEDFGRWYHAFVNGLIDRNRERFEKLVDPWWVCGIVFHDQIIRLVGSSWETDGMTIGLIFQARCCANPEKFWRVYETGVPSRLTSPLVIPRKRLLLRV
jgi:hypothetical protein